MLKPINICHTCLYRGTPDAGACHCDHSGREIRDHVKAGLCPIGKFGVKGNLPPRGAGDVLAETLGMLKIGPLLKRFLRRLRWKCGCGKRQEAMNSLKP